MTLKAPLLQEALNDVVSWANTNNMKINTKKIKEMMVCFSHQRPEVEPKCVDEVELSRVGSVKLLGLRISFNLSWDMHIEYIITRAQKCIFCLTLLHHSKVSGKDIVQMYCSKVCTHLEYILESCSEALW